MTVESKHRKHRAYLGCAYVWGVDFTMTKHTDHFVFTNTSEYLCGAVTTTVDKEQVHWCLQKQPLLEGVKQKKIPKTSRSTLRRATNVTLSQFRGWRRQKEPRFAQLLKWASRGLIEQFRAKYLQVLFASFNQMFLPGFGCLDLFLNSGYPPPFILNAHEDFDCRQAQEYLEHRL